MKHTKGPWTALENRIPKILSDSGMICTLNSNDTEEATDLANAHLIAAAPEMLEALERLVELFRPELQEKFNFTVNEKALAVGAIQAIKKARGES